jgi:Na+/proline symporter
MTTLTTLDWVVVGVYFVVLLAVVLAELRRQKTATDYFLVSPMTDHTSSAPSS